MTGFRVGKVCSATIPSGMSTGRQTDVAMDAAMETMPNKEKSNIEETAGNGGDARCWQGREAVKVSVQLGRDLHRRVKMEAVRRGETIVALLSRWAETLPAA